MDEIAFRGCPSLHIAPNILVPGSSLLKSVSRQLSAYFPEEFSPKMYYLKGEDNKAADAMSRLSMMDNEFDDVEWEQPNPPLQYEEEKVKHVLYPMASRERLENKVFPMAPSMPSTPGYRMLRGSSRGTTHRLSS